MNMNPVVRYFSGEKAESHLFILMGVLTILLASYFLLGLKTSFWKGAAIPFLLVALLEIVVGVTIAVRSPKDIVRVERQIKYESARILTEEIPRMELVMRNFRMYRYIEMSLVICGLVLMYAAGISPFWRGVGFGLFSQAAIVLCLDYFAEARGHQYLEYLKSFTAQS
jgi:hypothetical protein